MPVRLSRAGRGQGRDRGQSLVEFTLVVPLLLIILLGAIDFGRLLQARVSVESAVRAGSSWATSNLQTARQPLLPAGEMGNDNCGGNPLVKFSPSCNALARVCLEASGVPNFSGGTTYTGSGNDTYQTCATGSAANVCSAGVAQSNPFLTITWQRFDSTSSTFVTFVPGSDNPNLPLKGDRVVITGTYCFHTLANFPVIPSSVTLTTSSTYSVQQ